MRSVCHQINLISYVENGIFWTLNKTICSWWNSFNFGWTQMNQYKTSMPAWWDLSHSHEKCVAWELITQCAYVMTCAELYLVMLSILPSMYIACRLRPARCDFQYNTDSKKLISDSWCFSYLHDLWLMKLLCLKTNGWKKLVVRVILNQDDKSKSWQFLGIESRAPGLSHWCCNIEWRQLDSHQLSRLVYRGRFCVE